jgi:hypothetical protein
VKEGRRRKDGEGRKEGAAKKECEGMQRKVKEGR